MSFFNSQKSRVLIWCVAFLFSVAFGFLVYQGEQKRRKLTEMLRTKEEDLQLCFSDRAKVIKSISLPYSYQEFRVYSPLFVFNDMSVSFLSYKGALIKQMSLEVANGEHQKNPIIVTVWEYNNGPQQKKAIFDDYQKADKPWVTGDFSRDVFINEHGVVMERFFGYLLFSKDFTSIHSIFVKISEKNWQPYGMYFGTDEKQFIRDSTKALESFANTILR